jgi:hypothetical protein
MIGGFVLLSYREHFCAQVACDLPHHSTRCRIALYAEWHTLERRDSPSHESHHGMYRRKRCSAPPQDIHFIAGQCAAGMKRNLPLPSHRRGQFASRVCNLSIGHTKPDEIGIEHGIARGGRARA